MKSNKLVESKSDFTSLQHKIILLALVQIKPKDSTLRNYLVQISDVINSTNYHIVKKSVKKLQDTTIGIYESCVWIDYPFVENLQFLKQNKISFIEISFSKKVEDLLLGLRFQYTTYTLANVINFKHNYSLRLYEICKQFESVKYREISVNYLKTILNLENKYKKFFDFRLKVLQPSIDEINQHSDIFLKIKEYINNQKVTNLRFSISQNKAQQILSYLPSLTSMNKKPFNSGVEPLIKARLLSLGFSKDVIYKLESQYTNDKATKALDLLDYQKSTRLVDLRSHKKVLNRRQKLIIKIDYMGLI